MDSRRLIAEIKEDGWILVRVNGSHQHFTHPTKAGLVTTSHPKKDLPIKTVKSIRKQAGIKSQLHHKGLNYVISNCD
ncbi:type II toxin-antitoxin system HicA family toxin [Buttiauxella massiliensis]|uniref:type II toxin-antitoxin system HicA family toxin n=1 Tax=Buttiauxella massiliensis TaxID=2831590 RepID=UPI00125EC4C3|nr:type II toxin-antitoxin system HicA family toxin [Buttiauxella massiliensis]